MRPRDKVREAIREVLPFHPTAAQKRTLGEIVADMRAPSPMRRLLQGDVGSGKTIVALQAMLVAMENGYQAALMAPTEILATQHYLAMRKLLERSSRRYRIVAADWLARRRPQAADARRDQPGRGATGDRDACADRGKGGVRPAGAGGGGRAAPLRRDAAVQADEEAQAGWDGGAEPDVLVMTATPIPRTLALSLYGDLDVSVLDEMPPGRTPIVTRRVPGEMAGEVWDFVRKQVAQGRQAYIVYPVIEGTKEDQPELDFSHDDAEAGIEKRRSRIPGPKSGTRGTHA